MLERPIVAAALGVGAERGLTVPLSLTTAEAGQ